MEQIAFGKTLDHHACGEEFEVPDKGPQDCIVCERCGVRYPLSAWKEAVERAAAVGIARRQAVLDFFMPALYGRQWRSFAGANLVEGLLEN